MKKILFLIVTLTMGVQIQAQELISPELLWKIGRIGDEQVSPDGKKLLFGVTYYDLKKNKGNRDLYVLTLEGSGKGKDAIKAGYALKITKGEGSEYNARWRPDGERIGYLSAEDGSPQLYEVNADGSARSQITRLEGGIGNFAYSPSQGHISVTMDVKLDEDIHDMYPDLPEANARIIDELMYRHWNQWHDFAYSHVFYASYDNGKIGDFKDIMPKERFDSPLNPFGGGDQIAWNADGTQIAYTCKKKNGKEYAFSTNSEIYLYDLNSGKTTNMTEGMMGYDVEPSFSPDGKTMAWLSMEREGFESDRNRIFLMNIKSGKKEELTTGWDQSAGSLNWSKDSKTLYFTSAIRATYQIFQADIASKKISQVTKGYHNFYSVAEAGSSLIGIRASMSHPSALYRVNPKSGQMDQISKVNDNILRGVQWGQVRERTVKTTDGKDMLVWVIYPPDFNPTKKYPTLLYCQGGPQSAVSQFFSYRWNFQLMAANGYIIVAPNRRGLPSFGQEWNDEISGDWGGQAIKDYLSAIDDVAKEDYVDNDRLGAIGASYGGYSVYFLAGNHNKRFKTFISHCGLFNLEAWYGATEEMFFADWDLKGAYFDKEKPSSYEKFSPHKYVKNWDTPILVIHGQKDFRVPVTEGMQAFNVAQMKDIQSRFLYFPEEGHWVQSPQNGVLWHRVFFEWLDRTMRP